MVKAMNPKRTLHPIVRGLQPSPEQEGPILSRGKDIVVTAGAGTGKTRTLVARYLSLLAEGIPLRSILAITFTKKAAREMRNRVREEVRKYLLAEDLPEEEHDAWRRVYEGLDGARISTIHSLAGEILKGHPAEMGLDPEFEMLDENESARLKSLAVEAALTWAGSQEQTSGLFPVIGAWKLRRILGELLNKRLDVASALDGQPDDLWSLWQPILIAPLQEFIQNPSVRSGLDSLAELKYDGSMERAQEAGDLLVEDLGYVIESWETIKESASQGDWVKASRAVGPLRDHLKQKGKKDNWAPANPRAVIKEIQNIFQVTIGTTDLDFAVDRKLAKEIIPSLKALFQFANQWYGEAREGLNGLDFDDLEEKILVLFNEFPEVLSYWQGEIDSLLVDEYQDTNSRQRELVNLLNGGQKQLFIVGDGKQSIYRFRGADVEVFRQEQDRISREGEAYQLETSYRSHPQLLANLNGLLEPVLGGQSDLPYLEPFFRLKAGREKPAMLDLPAYIEFHLAAGSKAAGAGDLAAAAVATRLLEIFESDPGISADERINYGDVAVLCRASSSFAPFEGAFEQAGIPYTTVSGQGFYDRPEVRDVLNALQVFGDPQNDLALAGLMRSPVCGFPDQFLLDLRVYQFTESLGSLLDAARKYLSEMGGQEAAGLSSFILLVEEFSTLAGRVTAAELINRFLDRTGYAAGLVLAGQERGVSNLRKLVSDAHASGLVNLTDFLNSVREIRSIAIREGEAQFVSEGAVQIMTVHQAKGLEFPVVILGDAEKRDRFTRDILIDERFGLIPPFSYQRVEADQNGDPVIREGKSYAYELAFESERLKDEAEADRLLYVAATRAQDLLLLSGAVGNPTRDHTLPSLPGWIGKLAESLGFDGNDLTIDPEGGGIHQRQIRQDHLAASLFVYEAEVDPASIRSGSREARKEEGGSFDPASWENMAARVGAAEPAARPRKPIYSPITLGSASQAPARIVGEIVHHALERWKYPVLGEKDFLNWVEVEFRSAGVYDSRAIQSGYRRVRQILERFSATDLHQRMDEAERLLHEVPFALLDDQSHFLAGSIDALFLENGSWFVVEFKTDQIRQGDEIDWNSVDYLQQVENYLKAAESLIGQRPEPILCFLDYGGRVKLITDRW